MDYTSFVTERNEALLSLDREKIERFAKKYGVTMPTSEEAFWRGVHKAICNITNIPFEVRQKSADTGNRLSRKRGLHRHLCSAQTARQRQEHLHIGTISRGVTWIVWPWKRGRGDRNLEINSGNLTRCISRISQGSGYTEKELSEKAGLSVNTIYFWRTGRSTPTIHLFLCLLDAAGYRLLVEKREKGTE